MLKKPKIVFLKSTTPYTASFYYFKGMQKADVDIIEIPFDPHKQQPEIDFPEADLLLLIDCGLPIDFPCLRKYTCPKGYVSIDSCHKLDIHKTYCEKYQFDHIWVAQKHMVEEFGSNATWLPLAADEDIHVFKADKQVNERFWNKILARNHYDIGMCAAPFKHRRRFEKIFRKAGLYTHFYFRKKFGGDVTHEIAKCAIGFNVGAGFTGERGKDINMRIFETMANGQSMLLTNTYENIGYEDLFEEGKHFATYKSEEEAVEKAKYFSKHPVKASKIAREGQQHVLTNHTYTHRCKKILSALT